MDMQTYVCNSHSGSLVLLVCWFVSAVGKNTYLVKISIASSSYNCLCTSGSSVKDSSLMKA